MSFLALCPLVQSPRLGHQADCTSSSDVANQPLHTREVAGGSGYKRLCCSKAIPSAGSNGTYPTGVQAAAEGLPAGPAISKPPLTFAPTLSLNPAPGKISAQPAPKGSSKPLAARPLSPLSQPPGSQPPQASAGQPLPTLAQTGAGQPLAGQPGGAPGHLPTVPGALLCLTHILRQTAIPL